MERDLSAEEDELAPEAYSPQQCSDEFFDLLVTLRLSGNLYAKA